jgi:DeoR family transcriptional regulator, ulaG and ulaABCDEF operon transcriptional repressor
MTGFAQPHAMHASVRENLIISLVNERGFVLFRELEALLDSSPATIRRDLERLASARRLVRVRGGIKSAVQFDIDKLSPGFHLSGVPFHQNMALNREQKERIGRAAAEHCTAGEAIMIDGGSTTLQMCPYLADRNLSVLSNSLYIVAALINQAGTRVLMPGGAVFPQQAIILSISQDEGMPRFHAPKLFMGAAAIGPAGLMQDDPILVAAERRLISRSEEIIVLADASKFDAPSGSVVCGLNEIDILITDERISREARAMLEAHDIQVVLV